MPRSMRASRLETRTARLKLPVRKKSEWVRIGHGISLGYRRNQGPGTWSLRVANGSGGHWLKALASADDFADADGLNILDFWQAQTRARSVGLGSKNKGDGKLVTVKEAIQRYESDLKRRGADPGNADRVLTHLPDSLAAKTVALLASRDFQTWSDVLGEEELSAASINRVNSCFQAALNLAAAQDERIVNQRAWKKALASIPDATTARNVILPEAVIRGIIGSSYQVSPKFGLLVEVTATTGARPSQLGRVETRDLQADRLDPRLMMPSSRKGRGRKRIERRPVPIPADLATRLLAETSGRPEDAPLLTKPSGGAWKKSDHSRLFERAIKNYRRSQHAQIVLRWAPDLSAGVVAGTLPLESAYVTAIERMTAANDTTASTDTEIDWERVTIYALRHSNIVRALLANVPIRVVAANHDTSVAQLERTYSRFIADHSDTLSRRALFDIAGEATGENVVSLIQVRQ
jgi:hypothetical protein